VVATFEPKAALPSSAPLESTDSLPPMLLLHGWGCDHNDWSAQIQAFELLYTTIAPDLPGHGQAGSPQGADCTPRAMLRVLEDVVDAHFLGRPGIIMGHSLGGQLAALLALTRPDLVSALVLIDPTLGLTTPVKMAFGAFCLATKVAREPAPFLEKMFSGMYSAQTAPEKIEANTRRLRAMPRAVVRQSLRPIMFGQNQVSVGRPSERLCRSLACPVYSLFVDPKRADRVRPWFHHEQSVVAARPGSSHWIHHEESDRFNSEVLKWLAALAPGAA
jgi:pimeloyl-ACP methyl ester carboxylesterase